MSEGTRVSVTEACQTALRDITRNEKDDQADSPPGGRARPVPDCLNGHAGFRGPSPDHGTVAPATGRSHKPAALRYENRGGVMAKRHGRPSAQYRYEHYDPQIPER
jgi:hypothetical protein